MRSAEPPNGLQECVSLSCEHRIHTASLHATLCQIPGSHACVRCVLGACLRGNTFERHFRNMVWILPPRGGSAAPLLQQARPLHVQEIALERGVDINKHIPEKTLQLGPDTRRPLSLVGNTGDLTVPITEVEAYLALLGGMPEKYSVTSWITSGACHETAHCVDHVVQRQEYVGRLCQFWVQAFGEGSCS